MVKVGKPGFPFIGLLNPIEECIKYYSSYGKVEKVDPLYWRISLPDSGDMYMWESASSEEEEEEEIEEVDPKTGITLRILEF